MTNYSAGQANWIYSYGAVYAHDDFKLTSALTLNLGGRWDVDVRHREKNGNTSNSMKISASSSGHVFTNASL